MIILYISLILLLFGVIDAFLLRYIRQWESRKLKELQQQDTALDLAYKNMVKETQQLKAKVESIQHQHAASHDKPSEEPKERSLPSPQIDIVTQLVQHGAITQEQVNKARQYQKGIDPSRSIEEILIFLGSLDQKTLEKYTRS
ncbi:MAG: hypothetical protein CSA21_04430 [Deltaproteobacteria bacterium]|nr:MAG: hypothetical protein CSA21_04430 [Deltaproteobacteria bacterium]